MPRTSQFSKDQQIEIKAAMWEAKGTLAEVGREYGISGNMLSAIKQGNAWADIPWPGGGTGPMPAVQAEALKNQRSFQSRVGLHAGINSFGTPGYYNQIARDAIEVYRRSPDPGLLDEMEASARKRGFSSLFEAVRTGARETDDAIEANNRAEFDRMMAEINARPRPDMSGYPSGIQPPFVSLNPEATKKMDWEVILERWPDVPMVKEALASEDPDLKMAVRIGATVTPVDSSQFEMCTRDLLKKIKKWRDLQVVAAA